MLLLSKDHLQVGDQEYQVPGLLHHLLPGEQEDVHGHELRSSREVAIYRLHYTEPRRGSKWKIKMHPS